MRLCAKEEKGISFDFVKKIPIVFDVCATNTIGIFLDKCA